MKKILVLIICLAMIVSMFSPFCLAVEGNEVDEEIQPMYNVISSIAAGLKISSSGVASCIASLTGMSSPLTGKIIMELQQYSGGMWNTIMSWTESGSGGIIMEEYWTVPSGYSYRVRVTGNVYNANELLIESQYITSVTQTY